MTTVLVPGSRKWSMTRDNEGHREYTLTNLVRCDVTDGPANALRTAGLPTIGSYWYIDSDIDTWAFCKLDAEVSPMNENEPNDHFLITHKFRTRPDIKECKDVQFDDPTLEPQKISGSYKKYQEELTEDRFEQPVTNSAHEQIRGPQIEFDKGRPSVKIEQNVLDLEFDLCCDLVDTVNQFPLWGFPPRCVKLSNFSWERKFYGTCQVYYTRVFEFDINIDTFDRDILDEGTKVLHGHWRETDGAYVIDLIDGKLADHTNPQHFNRFQDRNGNVCRVLLNGFGLPAETAIANANLVNETTGTATGTYTTTQLGRRHIEAYHESDFLLLEIPTSF